MHPMRVAAATTLQSRVDGNVVEVLGAGHGCGDSIEDYLLKYT
jgi:hypothetical protein